MINCISIVATEDLLKIIFTHVSVALQVLHNEINFFLCIFYLLRSTTQFELCASGKNF